MTTQVDGHASRRLTGWLRDLPDHRDKKLRFSLLKTIAIPRIVDLRPYCPAVENQRELGSCTANAATSAIEFLYKKGGLPQPELSRLFLYYATRVWIAGEPPTADNGAMLRDVMKALVKYGTCVESLWPYAEQNFFAEPPANAVAEAESHQILHYYRCLDNVGALKQSLAEGYPLVGGFMVPHSIDDPEVKQTGRIPFPKGNEGFAGGHAVMLVGYNDDTKEFMFKNSWGTDWGGGGYGYLPYAYVEQNLADDFWSLRTAEM